MKFYKRRWIGHISREIPLWMYYARSLIEIMCALINLFTLPFGYVCTYNIHWTGRMLRAFSLAYKEKRR